MNISVYQRSLAVYRFRTREQSRNSEFTLPLTRWVANSNLESPLSLPLK